MHQAAGENNTAQAKVVFLSGVMAVTNARAIQFMQALAEEGFPVVALMANGGPDCQAPKGIRYRLVPAPSSHFWPNSRFADLARAISSRIANNLRIARWALVEHPTVVVCHEPDSWIIGLLVKLRTGAALIVDVREVYEDRASAFPAVSRGLVRWLTRRTMQWLARRTDVVIHVSEDRARFYNLDAQKVAIISHYADLHAIEGVPASSVVGRTGEFLAIHAGPLRANYAASELLRALSIASARVPGLVCLVLGGAVGPSASFQSLLEPMVKSGLVILLPYCVHREVIALMKACSVGLSLVLPVDATHALASPLKFYEYLGAGLPVIASDVPEIRAVVSRWQCGVVVDARDPQQIADALVTMAQNIEARNAMAANARCATREQLNWNSQKAGLVALFHDVMLQKGSPHPL